MDVFVVPEQGLHRAKFSSFHTVALVRELGVPERLGGDTSRTRAVPPSETLPRHIPVWIPPLAMSPKQPCLVHTYVECLFPQGRCVRWTLVVGGEPLVHRGSLVDGAGCRGLVVLVEGAGEDSREVRGVHQPGGVSRPPPVQLQFSIITAQFWDRRQPGVGHLLPFHAGHPQHCHVPPAMPAEVLTSRSPPG